MTKVRNLDQLLDIAARLFGEHGYEATTLEQIAQELGILKGSLYHYISSKAELLDLINRRRLEQLIAQAETIEDLDLAADAKLEQVMRAHLATLDQYYPESSQWFVEPAPPRGGASDAAKPDDAPNRDYERLVSRIIAAGMTSGVFRSDLDPQVAALTLLGSCNWLTRWYRRGGRLSIEEIGDTIIRLSLDGLSVSGAVYEVQATTLAEHN
jgi:AcrR family transcriptional regulator